MRQLTYLDRTSWDIKTDHPGGDSWHRVAVYIGRRETVTTIDINRPTVFALFALQANCNVNDHTVTLPYGIVVPKGAEATSWRYYVQAYGVVDGTRRRLTIAGVNESAGTITIQETVDTNTKVDVYCVPLNTPLLVEMRIEAPTQSMNIQRTFWVADIPTLVEREFWKSSARLLLPSGYPIPEDWMLTIWARCALPIRWRDAGTNEEVEHRIIIPVVIEHQYGLQKATKEGLYTELVK